MPRHWLSVPIISSKVGKTSICPTAVVTRLAIGEFATTSMHRLSSIFAELLVGFLILSREYSLWSLAMAITELPYNPKLRSESKKSPSARSK